MRDQHHVAGAHFGEHVDGPFSGAVDTLVANRVTRRPGGTSRPRGDLGLEVVDLLELGLLTVPLLVVLVRGVRAPVARRGHDFAGDDGVRVEGLRHAEVADLAGTAACAPQLERDLVCGDVPEREPSIAGGPCRADRDAGPGRVTRDRQRGSSRHVRHVGRTREDRGPTGEAGLVPRSFRVYAGHCRRAGQWDDDVLPTMLLDRPGLVRVEVEDMQAGVLPAGDRLVDHDFAGVTSRSAPRQEPAGVVRAHRSPGPPPCTRSEATATAAATSPSGGNSSARPTTRPRTAGSWSAVPQAA